MANEQSGFDENSVRSPWFSSLSRISAEQYHNEMHGTFESYPVFRAACEAFRAYEHQTDAFDKMVFTHRGRTRTGQAIAIAASGREASKSREFALGLRSKMLEELQRQFSLTAEQSLDIWRSAQSHVLRS